MSNGFEVYRWVSRVALELRQSRWQFCQYLQTFWLAPRAQERYLRVLVPTAPRALVEGPESRCCFTAEARTRSKRQKGNLFYTHEERKGKERLQRKGKERLRGAGHPSCSRTIAISSYLTKEYVGPGTVDPGSLRTRRRGGGRRQRSRGGRGTGRKTSGMPLLANLLILMILVVSSML